MSHVILDGTLISYDRVTSTTEKGNYLWYSGKAKHFAGNIHLLTAPTDGPLWVSDVEPGSVHDLRAARPHAPPALYTAARDGLPTLADVRYTGAGIGVHTHCDRTPTSPAPVCRQPRPQPHPARHPSPGRTSRRRPQTTLAHPAAHHPQPQPDRSHRQGTPDPQQRMALKDAENGTVRVTALARMRWRRAVIACMDIMCGGWPIFRSRADRS